MKRLTSKDPLPKEQEKELALKAKQGDAAALEELILCNMRFAVKVAIEYQGRGVDMDDLVGEATIALVEAARDFDPTKETKLITFAQYRIKAAIYKALAACKVPIDVVEFHDFQRQLRMVDGLESYSRWLRTVQAIRSLPLKDQDFLMKRFGLEGYMIHTLSDMAHEMGCSAESVRAKEKKLLSKLYDMVKEEDE